MKFASYNIQYGTGKDDRVDLGRISDEIGDADVIALQEVDRFWERSGGTDQAREIAAHFPEHHWVYGAGIDVDASFRDDAGRLVNRRRQFGNMLLALTPLLSSRNHLLPKLGMVEQLSLQRSALEAVIETPSGPLRVYSLHLGHSAAPERLRQIARLREILSAAIFEGGAWSGRRFDSSWSLDGPQPPMPRQAVLLGDFNLTPDAAEYEMLCGPLEPRYGRITTLDGLTDGWIAAGNDPDEGATRLRADGWVRIDYALVTAELADKVRAMRVDDEAQGSDHFPIWIEIDL